MPTLQADLDLQLDASLARLGELDDALELTAQKFSEELAAVFDAAALSAQDLVIPVSADTAPAEGEISDLVSTADAEVAQLSLFADTAAADTAIADTVATADGDVATLTVDADTSDADAAIADLSDSVDGLSGSSKEAGGAVAGLQQHTELLAGASGLAVGEVGGLKDAAGAFSGTAAVAAGGAFALGAGIAEIFHAGLDATSAEQRFNTVLGETAERVKSVQVGNLNTDLFELTKQMGSTEAATQNASATVFQFALNANASREQAAQFTDQIFALAARAVALKPSLGDVTDVAQRMEVGLGRARSAAQQFGIAISQAEINTRALQDTGKSSAADLTAYEKSVAGAEIALERYGSTLDQTVAQGSQNAAIQQRRLTAEFQDFLETAGKPLVAPGLELLKSGIPVAEQFAQAIADIARVALPVLNAALQVLGPLIEPTVVGFIALEVALKLASLANVSFAGSSAVATGALEAEAAASETAALGIAGFSGSLAATGGLAIAGAAAYELTTLALHAIFGASKDYTGALKEEDAATQAVITATNSGLLPAFQSLVEKAHEANNNLGRPGQQGLVDTLRAFHDVAQADVAQATALAEKFKGNAEVYRGMQQILAVVNQKHLDSAQAQAAAAAAADRLNVAAGAQATLVQQAASSQQAFAAGTGSASQALKDEEAASQGAKDALSLYKTVLDAVLGIHLDEAEASVQFANSLASVTAAVQKNGAAVGLDNQAQRDNEEAVLNSVRAAESLAEATFRRVQATDGDQAATKAANASLAEFTVQIRDTLVAQGLSADAANALLVQLGLLTAAGEPVAQSIGTWSTAATEAGPKVVTAADQAGSKSADALGSKKNKDKHKAAGQSNMASYIEGVAAEEPAIIKEAGDKGNAAATALEQTAPGFEAAGNALALAAAGGIARGGKNIYDTSTKAIEDAVNGLRVKEPDWEATGNVLAQATGTGVSDGGHFIGEGILAASQGALGRARTESEFWRQLGVSWAGGVAQGIEDGAGAISQAGIDALNTANTTSQALLNANSPSRLTRDTLGVPWSEGVAAGISLGAAGVSSAAIGVISDAVDATVASLPVALGRGPSAPSAIVAPVSAGSPATAGSGFAGAAGPMGGGPLVHVEHLEVSTPSPSPVDAGFESAKQLGAELWRLGV